MGIIGFLPYGRLSVTIVSEKATYNILQKKVLRLVILKNQFSFQGLLPTEFEAHCTDYNKTFPIKYGGRADINKHIISKRHWG